MIRGTSVSTNAELGKVIVGQEAVIEELLIALFCRGHALLVGVPGLAKTLLISTLAKTLGLSFSRIQFTPDLMPSDITGTEVIEEDKTTGGRQHAVRARAGVCQCDPGG
jgi:MoxR-like ATPase